MNIDIKLPVKDIDIKGRAVFVDIFAVFQVSSDESL